MIVQLNNPTGVFIGNGTNPIDENITIDVANSVATGCVCLFHNSTSEPTISGCEIVKSGFYKPDSLNLIWLTYIGTNQVLISYQQASVTASQPPQPQLTNITFNLGTKNQLSNPQTGRYSTASGTNYSAYGNSDFKLPANQLGYIEADVPDLNLNNVMFGLATSNVAGNWTLTKFNFTIFKNTTNPRFIVHQNGALLVSDAGQYYYGTNAKVRLQRNADGTCQIFKSQNGVDFELVFTYPEVYTGEMWFVTTIYNNQAVLVNPKGFNVVAK